MDRLRCFGTMLSATLLLWLSLAFPAHAVQIPASSFSMSEYVAELDHLVTAVRSLGPHPEQASALINEIPPRWQVQARERTFTISTEWLRRDLGQWRTSHDPAGLKEISEGLRALRSEAESFELPSDMSGSRALLSRILADREFQGIHGPTAIDSLKQRIQRFFFWLLGRAFRSAAIPAISRVLVNVLIGFAVLIVAYLMYRAIRRTAVLETTPLNPPPRSAKEWTLWLTEAQAAANNGSWRDAIHLAYWCGISFLEAQGVWRPDRARTPREYLRLLPPSSEYLPTLTTLTRALERVWYGTEDANAEAFAQALTDLKKLGCPSS